MSKEESHIEKPRKLKLRFALVILALGITIVTGMYWTQSMKVQDITFAGNHYTETELLTVAAAIPTDIHPDSMDLIAIKDRIESLNYVKSVEIEVEPGGDLVFQVSEREPLALLIDGSLRSYVDEDGVLLPLLEDKYKDLPLVYGFSVNRSDTLKSEAYHQISNFLQTARNNTLHWMTISEVAYSAEEGVVALSYENGVKLIFGRNNFDHKLANWGTFYTEVIRVKGMQSMSQIDLRFKNQVVTKEI